MSGTRLPFRDRWIVELRLGTLDAYLALLLVRLPRLRRLSLGPVFFTESELTGLVLRSGLDGHRSGWLGVDVGGCLRELRTVLLIRSGQYHLARTNRNTESILPFFYLPSLEEIVVSMDNPLAPALPWPIVQRPVAASLISLEISGGIRESHLGQLLAVMPCLRILRWTWRFDPDHEDQYNNPVVDLDQLIPALLHVRETLTELTILAESYEPYFSHYPPPLRVQGSMIPLAGFHRLTKLFIPLDFFTGFSLPAREPVGRCLPYNLEEVTLADDLYIDSDRNERWDEAGHTGTIVTWLADMESLTPQLRKLCLVLQACDGEISLDDLKVKVKIQNLARLAGVEVTTLHVHEIGEMRLDP